MDTIVKKQAILQSIDSMNEAEMEKVLDYIKGLLNDVRKDIHYLNFKANAMNEIRNALENDEAGAVA